MCVQLPSRPAAKQQREMRILRFVENVNPNSEIVKFLSGIEHCSDMARDSFSTNHEYCYNGKYIIIIYVFDSVHVKFGI